MSELDFKIPEEIELEELNISKELEKFFWSAMDERLTPSYYVVAPGTTRRMLEGDLRRAMKGGANEFIHYRQIHDEYELRTARNIILGLKLIAREKGIEFGAFRYDSESGAIKSKYTQDRGVSSEKSINVFSR